jgi:superfamily II DNA or RNA helicase
LDIRSLTPGMHVAGIIHTEAVEIVAARPSGDSVNVVYMRLDGSYDSIVLFPEDLEKVSEVAGDGGRRFDADAGSFLLASEALRIRYSYAFDNRLAMHTSLIEPLPHQITAVYEDMLPRQPLRFLLADDPGAGKTIMAGLLIKELMIRGEVERCLIVCPGGLVQQWVEDELGPKFGLEFRMLTNDIVDSTRSGNPFRDIPLMVASMDKLARDERLKAMLGEVEWDLVVVDEAHKMAAHRNGRKVDATRRYRLGELLRDHTRNLLLMTATPHNGKEGDFQEFMKLLDRDRFEGGVGAGLARDTDGMMRRLQKEELLTFEGKPLFPIREARTLAYTLSAGEQSLYEHVTDYVREGFNRADRIVRQDRRNAVGFALTSLQRRLASSPMAAWKSIERRRLRLEKLAREVREHGTYTVHPHGGAGHDEPLWDDWDDEDIDEAQDDDTLVLDDATASETLDELEAEISELRTLESEASDVYHRGEDKKWGELLRLLESEQMKKPDGSREKLIVFTEYADTLEYLEGKLSSYLGSAGRLRTIRGGMNRDQRRQVEADFKQNDDVSVLVATDAAGEGINLQVAHILINYDLPWNPNRIEQRFGRIHRIGQRHTCYMYNLVADGTREGEVWHRLFQKLEQESETLHGRVFDVLGQVTYDDKTLSELLLDAIRRDSTPERQSYLDTVIDSSLDTDRLKSLMATDVLATDSLDVEDVRRVREDIERANAMRLQPHYIRSFFARALEDLGGRLVSNRDGTFRMSKVPLALRVSSSGVRRPLAERYASLAFDKGDVKEPGKTDLVCVGHPLLDATVEETLARHGDSLGRGSILVDDANRTLAPRELLTYLLTLVDGCGQVCERRLYYVEVEQGKEPVIFGQAPYIDYRPPSEEEAARLDSGALDPLSWERDGEARAERALMDGPVSHDVREISEKRAARVDKVEEAVRQRLNHAIATASTEKERWAERARSGDEGARPTAANKKRELESLIARRDTRLRELEGERMVRPKPITLVSAAVVLPSRAITSNPKDAKDLFEARKASEERGMDAVMHIERQLHHDPKDVSRLNVGWDVQSYVERADGTGDWRFIESKGVREDADTVTLSPNEVRKAAGNSDTFVLAVTRPLRKGTRTTYYFGAVRDDYNPALDSYPYKLSMLEERAASCETYDIEDGKCTRKS